jgi:cytoskeletal protein CcmA (bactofilin family)
MDGAVKKTLVEEGTEFKGSLTSRCPVEVRGRVEGDLEAPSLQVTTTGGVSGKVKVGKLISDGELAGELDADAALLAGTVKDNTVIRAKTLEVKLTAQNGSKMQVIFGEVTLDVGDAPREPVAPTKKTKTIPPASASASASAPSASAPPPPKSVPPPIGE